MYRAVLGRPVIRRSLSDVSHDPQARCDGMARRAGAKEREGQKGRRVSDHRLLPCVQPARTRCFSCEMRRHPRCAGRCTVRVRVLALTRFTCMMTTIVPHPFHIPSTEWSIAENNHVYARKRHASSLPNLSWTLLTVPWNGTGTQQFWDSAREPQSARS